MNILAAHEISRVEMRSRECKHEFLESREEVDGWVLRLAMSIPRWSKRAGLRIMDCGPSPSLFPNYNRGSTDPQTSKHWPQPVPIHRHTNLHNPIVKILAAREIRRVEVRGEVVVRVRAPGCGVEEGGG